MCGTVDNKKNALLHHKIIIKKKNDPTEINSKLSDLQYDYPDCVVLRNILTDTGSDGRWHSGCSADASCDRGGQCGGSCVTEVNGGSLGMLQDMHSPRQALRQDRHSYPLPGSLLACLHLSKALEMSPHCSLPLASKREYKRRLRKGDVTYC